MSFLHILLGLWVGLGHSRHSRMCSLDLCWPVNGCAHQHLQHLHNSCWCVNKSTTIVPIAKNIELTLVLTDRINGTTWLAEKVTSSSLTGLEVPERRHTTVRMLFYLRKRLEKWPWKQAKNKLISMSGLHYSSKKVLGGSILGQQENSITSITVWFGSATKLDKSRLHRTTRTAERILWPVLPLSRPPPPSRRSGDLFTTTTRQPGTPDPKQLVPVVTNFQVLKTIFLLKSDN